MRTKYVPGPKPRALRCARHGAEFVVFGAGPRRSRGCPACVAEVRWRTDEERARGRHATGGARGRLRPQDAGTQTGERST